MTGRRVFVFTDVEGSTRLWERHPVAMVEALARHMRILQEAVTDHGGRVVKETGDGIFAVFPDERGAALAATTAQLGVEGTDWQLELPLRVRIGLHAGWAVEVAGDYHGPTVNRCARICDAAHGGQIVASDVVATALEGEADVHLRDLGRHRLPDLERPERLFQIDHPDLPSEFPPLRTLEGFPNNLPAELSTFVGREDQLAEVAQRLARSRLLTLVGPGGVGKTRLALQTAAGRVESFPDGVWLVELAGLSDPELVAQSVATTLRILDEPGRSASERVVDHLQGRRVLLVLDNCEHLLGACARFAEDVLRRCPKARVMATSREALNVTGETVWHVPPLDVTGDGATSEAVTLFVDRAAAVRPDLEFDAEDRVLVARICRRLDGLPLAIELAAARVRALSIGDVAARLDDRFRLLTGGSRTALPRQRTLEAAVDWSYDLLDGAERRAFEDLSVFAGSFPLDAVDPVLGEDGIDLVVSLVDRSLVNTGREAEGGSRYRMLETVRAYARKRLAQRGDAAAVRDRHVAWAGDLAERAGAALDGPEQLRWLERVELELDNLRGAMQWALDGGEPSQGVRIATALYRYWYVRGVREGREWLERLLPAAEDLEGEVAARALYAFGSLVQVMGEYERSAEILRRSVELFRGTGNRRGLAYALHYLGRSEWGLVPPDENLARFEEAHALFEDVGDPVGVGLTRLFTSMHATERGEAEVAERQARELDAIFRDIGAPHLVAHGAEALGWACVHLDQPERAGEHYREAIDLYDQVGNRACAAHCLEGAARLLVALGDHHTAAELLGATEALRERIGVPPPPYENMWFKSTVAAVTEELPTEELHRRWGHGRDLPFRDALAAAHAAIS